MSKESLQAFLLGDGVNAPDAAPTPTPTAEQTREAAAMVALADIEVAGQVPDAYIEGVLRRLGAPVSADNVEAVKAAARQGAPAVAPVALPPNVVGVVPIRGTTADGPRASTDEVEVEAPADAPALPGVEAPVADEVRAAFAIAEAMRTAAPPALFLSVKRAKVLAREATGWSSVSAKRWAAVVAAAFEADLWVARAGVVGIAADEVESLTGPDLGWTPLQVARMLPAERARVWRDDLQGAGHSVMPSGEVQAVGAPPNTEADLGASIEVKLDPPLVVESEPVALVASVEVAGVDPAIALAAIRAAAVPAMPPPPGHLEEHQRQPDPDAHAGGDPGRWHCAYVGPLSPDASAAIEKIKAPPVEVDLDRADALDKAAAADAREALAGGPALPFSFVVFVGCHPVGVGVEMSLDVLTGPFERQVEADAGVAYYGLVDYAKGPLGVAAYLRQHLAACPPVWRTIYVDPAHPCAAACLPVLAQLPGALVVRS